MHINLRVQTEIEPSFRAAASGLRSNKGAWIRRWLCDGVEAQCKGHPEESQGGVIFRGQRQKGIQDDYYV